MTSSMQPGIRFNEAAHKVPEGNAKGRPVTTGNAKD